MMQCYGVDCLSDDICYLVKDLQRARSFYEDEVGLVPSVAIGNSVEYAQPGGHVFVLRESSASEWIAGGGAIFQVHNAQALADELRTSGRVVLDLFETPVGRLVWCVDSEGNDFALFTRG